MRLGPQVQDQSKVLGLSQGNKTIGHLKFTVCYRKHEICTCAKNETALEATQSKLQVSSFGRSKSMKIDIFTPYSKSFSEQGVYQTNL